MLAARTPLCESIGRGGRPTTGTILSCLLPLSSALCQHLYVVHLLQFVAALAAAGTLFARSRTPSNRRPAFVSKAVPSLSVAFPFSPSYVGAALPLQHRSATFDDVNQSFPQQSVTVFYCCHSASASFTATISSLQTCSALCLQHKISYCDRPCCAASSVHQHCSSSPICSSNTSFNNDLSFANLGPRGAKKNTSVCRSNYYNPRHTQ
ncbi:hypothetical protein BHM03_00059641 [Ensete ventricosum]|nr:hypothetical protein BHM03_00059641 [Ensete ventricosum]